LLSIQGYLTGRDFLTKKGRRSSGMNQGLANWALVFLPNHSSMLVSGEPTLTRRLISLRVLEPLMRLIQKKDKNGISHYPGWSMEVLTYLFEQRKVTAIGHEPTDTDPGVATSKDDYSLETYVLSTNHYQIEILANLDQVPEAGALVIVSFPKPKGGSGFPARAFAILPE